jgi:chromosome segregation ATPase
MHFKQLSDKWRSITVITPILAAVIAMVGALAAGWVTSQQAVSRQHIADTNAMEARRQRDIAERTAAEGNRLQDQVADLERTNAALRHALAEHERKGSGGKLYAELNPMDRHQLEQLNSSAEQLQTRLTALEAALMNTPEKALSVPMLKQQVDTLQDRTKSDFDGVHGEIGRLFTLTQWFIGLMFTIALGIFGLALANLRRPEKPALTAKDNQDK